MIWYLSIVAEIGDEVVYCGFFADVEQIFDIGKIYADMLSPFSMFMSLRNLKSKINEDRIITAEPFKKASDCFKLFGISCPDELMLLE